MEPRVRIFTELSVIVFEGNSKLTSAVFFWEGGMWGHKMLRPVWYENLSGVVIRPENSNINTDGLDSVVIGSRDQ